MTIAWLSTVVERGKNNTTFWGSNHNKTKLSESAVAIWKHHESEIAADVALKKTFSRLVDMLVETGEIRAV